MLALVIVIIVLIAAAVIHRVNRSPKTEAKKGAPKQRSKPTEQKKR